MARFLNTTNKPSFSLNPIALLGFGLVLLFFLLGMVFPLFDFLKQAFLESNTLSNKSKLTFSYFIEYFSSANTASSLHHSLITSFSSTIIASTASFLFALAVVRSLVPYRKIVEYIALLPLFLPSMILGLGFIYLFGRQGIITKVVNYEFQLYGFWGIILAQSLFLFPILYLIFVNSLRYSDNRLYEFSTLAGIAPIKQFFSITLKQQHYSWLIAFSTGFILSFSDFGIPKIIGGNYNVLATDIYKQIIGQQNLNLGAVVASLLLLPTILFSILESYLGKKMQKTSQQVSPLIIKKNIVRDIGLGSLVFIITFIIISLIGVVIYSSVIKRWPYNFSFTLEHYHISTLSDTFLTLITRTTGIALFTAILATPLTFFLAFLTEKETLPSFTKRLLHLFALFPNAIPGLSIGLSFVYFFNKKDNPLNFLYGTIAILILANIIHFFTNPYLNSLQALKKVDKSYDDCYKLFGLSRLYYFYKVLLPLNAKTLLDNFSYFFTNSMITISALIFLYTPETNILSTMMTSRLDSGLLEDVAVLGVILLVINILFRFLLLGSYTVYNTIQSKTQNRSLEAKKHIYPYLKSHAQEALKLLADISQSYDIPLWLSFGTLLSQYRDASLQHIDNNLDLGIWQKDMQPKFLEALSRAGFTKEYEIIIDGKPVYILYRYQNLPIELFLFIQDKNDALAYCLEDDSLVYYHFPNMPLREVSFLNVNIKVPSDTDIYLRTLYGDNYTESDALWLHEKAKNRKICHLRFTKR